MKRVAITCCKGCENRHLKCHTDCDLYLQQKAELDETREDVQQCNKLLYNDIKRRKYYKKILENKRRSGGNNYDKFY